MTYTDDDLATLVRDDVSNRPGAPADLDRVLGRGRRRVAVRRGVTGAVAAAVLAGATALALGQELPLLSSAPPAAPPSVMLTPDPRRTEALRPVVDMYEIGDDAARAAGLEPSGRWSVARDATTLDGELVYDGAVEVSGAGDGYGLSTAHVPSLEDPGSVSCAQVSPPPFAGPGLDCAREPQPDGSVLFTLGADGEVAQLRLVHSTGVVTVTSVVVDGQGQPMTDLPGIERLRELVLDPTLRW